MIFSGMSTSQIAARIAVFLFAVVAVIQLAIAAGIAPVTIVWGGGQTHLTLRLRFASLAAAIVLIQFAWIVQTRTEQPNNLCLRVLSWLITAYMAVNTLGNFTSPSWFERYIFGAFTVILTICAAIVASSSTQQPADYESLEDDEADASSS